MTTELSLQKQLLGQAQKTSRAHWQQLTKSAGALKANVTSADAKNRLWAIENFASGVEQYLDAHRQMRRQEYYEGWRLLEQAEIAFQWNARNPFLPDLVPLVTERATVIARWQSLFPYKLFASPGMRLRDWACSICGKKSTPISPCGHRPGIVYAGELCIRVIKSFEALEVSIVTDPVQKYSVLFPEGLTFDYSLVDFALSKLKGPFQQWDGNWTKKRHSHEQFLGVASADPCPCSSQLRYAECCLPTEGVLLPHFAMTLEGNQPYSEDIRLIKPRPTQPGDRFRR